MILYSIFTPFTRSWEIPTSNQWGIWVAETYGNEIAYESILVIIYDETVSPDVACDAL